MAVLTTNFTGEIGVKPRLIRLDAPENTFSEVTTPLYLNRLGQAAQVQASDMVCIFCSDGQFLARPLISSGSVTLEPLFSRTPTAVVAGDFAVFDGTEGALEDLGYSPTNAAKTKVIMANAAMVVGNAVKAADTAGTLADAGYNLKSATTASWGGGSTSHTFTAAGLTSASIVTAVIVTSANAVGIAKLVPGTDQIAVTFTADPGAGTTVNWIATSAVVA